MAKFSVGEKVIFVNGGDGWPTHVHRCRDFFGSEFTIIAIDDHPSAPYLLDLPFNIDGSSDKLWVTELCLRKRRPPEQPADQDFQEWFKKTIVKEAPGMDVVYRHIAEVRRGS